VAGVLASVFGGAAVAGAERGSGGERGELGNRGKGHHRMLILGKSVDRWANEVLFIIICKKIKEN
jgi:hypothetical protein